MFSPVRLTRLIGKCPLNKLFPLSFPTLFVGFVPPSHVFLCVSSRPFRNRLEGPRPVCFFKSISSLAGFFCHVPLVWMYAAFNPLLHCSIYLVR